MSDTINESLGISSEPKSTSVKQGGYFSFSKMISPQIIKVVHVIGLIALIIIAINFIAQGIDYDEEFIVYGILILILGPFVWRILCEGWILAFSIHEVLVSIEKKLK